MLWFLLVACGGDCPVVDADGDGAIAACPGAGAGEQDGVIDCDDADPTTRPGADEVCDGLDNDCDGEADDGITLTYYRDEDGDGYGDLASAIESCTFTSGYTRTGGDCDDADPDISPQVAEVCDGIDNDCDGAVDDGAGEQLWYADADGDGTPGEGDAVQSCTAPDGLLAAPAVWDCDDGDPDVGPHADEVCDGVDNDCDGEADEGVPSTWYVDADGDGLGGDTVFEGKDCNPPDGYALRSDDCDDQDPAVGDRSPTPLDGNVLISAAADMASVCPCYTDLSDTLRVRDLADSADLAGLSCVERVGELAISSSDSLTSLDGLGALESIDGALTIEDNAQLSDTSGLAGLADVGGGVTVDSNPALADLSGLSALASIGGVLTITANDAMTTVGLSALEQVGLISISSCDALEALTSMTALVEANAIRIEGCGALTDIDLPVLESMGGDLYLFNNPSLATLSAPALAEVGGELRLHWLGDVLDLDDLSSIEEVGSLVLWGNASLEDVSGLSSIGLVRGDLTISKNGELATADAEALRDAIGTDNIRGSITISDNAP